MKRNLSLRLQHRWAVLRGRDIRALILMDQILMADFTAFDAALDRVVAQSQANATALAAAQSADANLQAEIDARTAKLDAIAPVPPVTDEVAQGSQTDTSVEQPQA